MELAKPELPKVVGSTKKLGTKYTAFEPVNLSLNRDFHAVPAEDCPNLQFSPEKVDMNALGDSAGYLN